MADITMCSGNGCTLSYKCYRHNAKPDLMWQSYFANPPIKDGKCDELWEMNANKDKASNAKRNE